MIGTQFLLVLAFALGVPLAILLLFWWLSRREEKQDSVKGAVVGDESCIKCGRRFRQSYPLQVVCQGCCDAMDEFLKGDKV